MAKLYNFCTYNGVRGGRYQSTSWDVCCGQWTERPTGNPADWECGSDAIAEWYCAGVNPQTWTEGETFNVDWLSEDDTNPQAWSCTFEIDVEWFLGFPISPQVWEEDEHDPVPWFSEDTPDPEPGGMPGPAPVIVPVWGCGSAAPATWGASTATPEPVVYEQINADERAGKDCGN